MISFKDKSKVALIGDVPIDVLREVKDPDEAEMTEHAVDEGPDFNDHIYIKPKNPIYEITLMDSQPGLTVDTALSVLNGTFSTATWRAKRDRLKEYFNEKTIIDITDGETLQSDMIILLLDRDFRTSTANEWRGRIEMRKARILQPKSGYVDARKIPKAVKEGKTDAQKAADKKKLQEKAKGTKKRKSTLGGVIDTGKAAAEQALAAFTGG